METYSDWSPTPLDTKGPNCEDQQDWLVAPGMTTRDTPDYSLDASNYACMKAAIEEADPEGEDHEEHSFNHWGPGWFSIILVRPGSKAAEAAQQIEDSLSDYPCLSDEDYSDRQCEEQYRAIEDAAPFITGLPEDWKRQVYDQLEETPEGRRALDCSDSEGCYIDKELMLSAYRALGWLACEHCDSTGIFYPCRTAERSVLENCHAVADYHVNQEEIDSEGEYLLSIPAKCATCPLATCQATICPSCHGTGERGE